MNKYRVALISRSPFPFGDVSTSRYSTYCKALANFGIFTKVYILHPSKSAEAKLNRKTEGVYEGINFQYLSSDTYWPISTPILLKQVKYMFNVIKSLFYLHEDKIDVIILYHHDYYNLVLYRIFCSIFRVKLLTDKTEYPYFFSTYGKTKKLITKVYLKLFDKYFVMTHELFDFYSSFLNKDKSLFFHLPMSVDVERFENIEVTPGLYSYIACCFGTHNRDCVLDTIKAYKIYSEKNDDSWSLNLYGNFGELKDASEILLYVNDNDLGRKVSIKGLVNSNDMPNVLINAKCLITTAREYVSGGFPTKLGEYLATRKPIVCTKAGEIPLYLEDGKNCLLATPGDIKEIAQKLQYVHDHYDEALCIAERGYLVGISEFNVERKIQDLIRFFD